MHSVLNEFGSVFSGHKVQASFPTPNSPLVRKLTIEFEGHSGHIPFEFAATLLPLRSVQSIQTLMSPISLVAWPKNPS